jgi:hypothetical protein
MTWAVQKLTLTGSSTAILSLCDIPLAHVFILGELKALLQRLRSERCEPYHPSNPSLNLRQHFIIENAQAWGRTGG